MRADSSRVKPSSRGSKFEPTHTAQREAAPGLAQNCSEGDRGWGIGKEAGRPPSPDRPGYTGDLPEEGLKQGEEHKSLLDACSLSTEMTTQKVHWVITCLVLSQMPPSALLGDILPNRLLSSSQPVRHEQNDLINVHKSYVWPMLQEGMVNMTT